MTGTEIITGVQMLLHADSNEKAWTEDEIILAANIQLRNYSTQLANSNSGRYYAFATLTATIGDNNLALPDNCNGIVEFAKYNKVHLKPDYMRNLLDEPSSSTPERFAIYDDFIYLYPAPAAAYSIKIGYWRSATSITVANKANDIDFPDSIAPVVMYDAAIFCALKHEAYVADIREARNEWFENLLYHKAERIKLQSFQVAEAGDLRTLGD